MGESTIEIGGILPASIIFLYFIFIVAMELAYLCKSCNIQFESEKDFEGHTQKRHAEGCFPEAKVVCLNCHRKYNGMKGFRAHLRLDRCFKRIPASYKCRFCEKDFLQRASYEIHEAFRHQNGRCPSFRMG